MHASPRKAKPETFGQYLQQKRTESEHSIRHVARLANVNLATVIRLEADSFTVPSPGVLVALIDALDLDPVVVCDLIEPYKKLLDRLRRALPIDVERNEDRG